MLRLADAKLLVCDIAGMYDRFSVQDALSWIGAEQVVRDAIRELVKEGLLRRVARGVYEWR